MAQPFPFNECFIGVRKISPDGKRIEAQETQSIPLIGCQSFKDLMPRIATGLEMLQHIWAEQGFPSYADQHHQDSRSLRELTARQLHDLASLVEAGKVQVFASKEAVTPYVPDGVADPRPSSPGRYRILVGYFLPDSKENSHG